MNKKYIVLISKDATLPEYFNQYGGHFFKTPNIDRIAKNGTVFMRHFAAGASTAMSFIAMFTGKYPYQTHHSSYRKTNVVERDNLFDKLHSHGYECHLMWSKNYIDAAEKYSMCFGNDTIHHESFYFNEHCGHNSEHEWGVQYRNLKETDLYFSKLMHEIDSIDLTKKIFLWIHMPHCIKGRISYGDDIEVFDKLIGELAKKFGDDSIYITADHGHMNGQKNVYGYGFDVYDSVSHIPLITPRIQNYEKIEFNTSNTQISEIILDGTISKKEYVLCDSAYYAQKNRKIAIIKDDFYYIYNKRTKTEELYDIGFDYNQNINFALSPIIYDKNRHSKIDIRQLVYYPKWDYIPKVLEEMREIKKQIWKKGSFLQETKISFRQLLIRIRSTLRKVFKKRRVADND